MNIFVGNIAFVANEEDIKKLFEGFGSVASVVIVREKKRAKSRGFGFVEMSDDRQAQEAISALDGKDFMDRPLRVSPVQPKTEEERSVMNEQKKELRLRNKPSSVNKWGNKPVFERKGGYKGGRRTRSYAARNNTTLAEQQAIPRRKVYNNPMRWRKNSPKQKKPWQKNQGGNSPWKKPESKAKLWRKSIKKKNGPK